MIFILPSGNSIQIQKSGLDIFLAAGVLFFLGTFTHVFSSSAGTGTGSLKILFLPLALLFQLGAIIVLASKPYQQKTLQLLHRNLLLLLSLFFILASVLWSIDKAETIRRSIALVGTTAFGVLLGLTYARSQLLSLFKYLFLVLIIISVCLAVFLPQYGTHQFGQFAGFWRGALSFKNQMGWSAGVFIILWFAGNTLKNCFTPKFLIGLSLGLLLLLQTRSSTGIIVTAAAILVLLAIYSVNNFQLFRPIILCFFILLLAIVLGFYDVVFEMILNSVGKDASLTGRTSIWMALLPSIENNLFLGVGYSAFWPNAISYFGPTWMAELNHAHNTYIELLVDLGLLGSVFCLLFLFATGKRFYKDLMKGFPGANTVFALFVMVLIVGFSGKVIFVPNSGIWLLLVAFSVCSSQQNINSNKGKK